VGAGDFSVRGEGKDGDETERKRQRGETYEKQRGIDRGEQSERKRQRGEMER
jgi:hypothetical protein